jgi:hypothetical protein
MPSKCGYVSPFCRKVSRGRKAKKPCSKTVNGQKIDGTRIRGHSRPKGCLNHQAEKIQSLARARSARKAAKARLSAIRTIQSYSRRKNRKSKGGSKGGSKGAGPSRKSGRTVKARKRLIEE